jgi:ESS family glutamate:Na+ symporter
MKENTMVTNYESFATWGIIIYVAILSLLLLTGNVIRRKIPILKKSLLPTSVIAGLLGLIIKEAIVRPLTGQSWWISETDIITFNTFLNLVTYHTIAIGFIAMGLKVNEKFKIKTQRAHSYYNGMVIVSSYMLQGIIGIGVTAILAFTIFPIFKTGPGLASGILVPFGFGQGPGQANNFGAVYEGFTNAQGVLTGFAGAQSYGLAIASMGFIWACIGGVIYLNKVYKKKVTGEEQLVQTTSVQEVESPDEIPVAESIDKLTVQLTLIAVVYGVTLLIMFGLTRLASFNEGIYRMVGSLIWGFNFIFGMVVALFAKKLFGYLRQKNIMTRQYPNNYMLNRIAGVVFDFMVVASIVSINIEDLASPQVWITFFLITTIAGLSTMFFIHKITKRVYKQYTLPAFAGMYGTMTGTVSTGIALLREVDPYYETPAATDLVTGTTTAIIFGFPILLLASFAPNGTVQALITLGILIVLFSLFVFILLKKNPKP